MNIFQVSKSSSLIEKENEKFNQKKNTLNKNSELISHAFKIIQKNYKDIPYNFVKHQINPINLCNHLMKMRYTSMKYNENQSNISIYYKAKGIDLNKLVQNQAKLKISLNIFLVNKNLQIKNEENETGISFIVND